jgi:hypothetical protein
MNRGDKNPATDRGWAMGTVGWGVLGAFGSHQKDEGAQVQRKATGKNKMVRNEKGLWVKAKELNAEDEGDGGEEEEEEEARGDSDGGVHYVVEKAPSRGRGRGGGIPLIASHGPQSSRSFPSKGRKTGCCAAASSP